MFRKEGCMNWVEELKDREEYVFREQVVWSGMRSVWTGRRSVWTGSRGV